MKIINTYSFKGGEKYLKEKHPKELMEVLGAIEALDATLCLTKESKEKTMNGKMLFSPIDLNKEFNKKFNAKNWNESRYQYYITTDPKLR